VKNWIRNTLVVDRFDHRGINSEVVNSQGWTSYLVGRNQMSTFYLVARDNIIHHVILEITITKEKQIVYIEITAVMFAFQ
jgi:hypothetical protein